MSHTPPPIQDEIPEKSLIQSQPHLNREEDSNKKENLVKWLYPFDLEEGVENMADDAASAVAAAAETASNESGKKPPMTHQDSLEDKGSVDSCDTKETSDDDEIDVSEITEEITKQVTAGATALGSMFNTAWSKTQKAATTGVTSGVKASTSLFNFAAGYDLNKPSDDEDDDFAEGASSVTTRMTTLPRALRPSKGLRRKRPRPRVSCQSRSQPGGSGVSVQVWEA